MLTDGRSPAPRVAGSLLIALRRAGAVRVSAPVCTGCGKPLNTFQRRGQDWYCGVCGPTPTRCVGCGNIRKITSRDRQGRPRCHGCPPDDDGDPILILLQVITAVDPNLAPTTATDAVLAVTSRAGQRRRLAWALQDHPELLTGAGAQAPVPSVLRLIDALIGAGAHGIVRPPCPRLRTRHHAEQGPRRSAGLPQLLRQIARRNMLALRCPPRTSHPGRARKPVVSTLLEHRSGQPGNLFRLWSPPSGQCPRRRRAAVSVLPGEHDDDLFDLRPLGPRGGLQAHREALLPCMFAAASTLHRLRHGQADPRRHPRRTGLRGLHPPGRVGARLPRLRRAQPTTPASVRALLAAGPADEAARRRHRSGPSPAAGPARTPGRTRTSRHRARLAAQGHRVLGAG